MGQSALLIIDMQNDFALPGAPLFVDSAPEVLPQIVRALDAARATSMPVVHVIRNYRADGSDVEITRYEKFCACGGACVPGTRGAEILEDLAPEQDEHLIVKPRWSAFFHTDLDDLLTDLDVDQVVLAGVQTPNCIRATAWDANSLDYEVVVLTDATGAKTGAVHRANLLDMRNIGIKLMGTEEFCASAPDIPKEGYAARIRTDLNARKGAQTAGETHRLRPR